MDVAQWAVAQLRHRRNPFRCPLWRSRPFAWSGRRRIDGAIRCRQLRAITFRRTARRHLFSVEDANSPRALLGPRGAFTRPRRPSDALFVTRRHVRSASVPTDPLSASCIGLRLPHEPEIHLQTEGPCFTLPVKVVRAKAREHLPSYREPASRNPQADHAPTFLMNALRRAPFRLFSARAPRQRCFELPSG